jgi:DNA helicase-2/ATP-dependent DNA helicase PcrA
MENSFNNEVKHLKFVENEYSETISNLEIKIRNLPILYNQNFEKINEERRNLNSKILLLKYNKDNPYFARVDFKQDNSNNIDICYIGKIGLLNLDNQIIVIDWRAPIASLYYDSDIGNAEYSSPNGKIFGNLLIKRKYNIKNGNLISYDNVDIISSDKLLSKYLDENKDNRLKNIVSTIQKEQNDIIRYNVGKNLIVQGVAGSGKTTVVLHRIAYLVYNYRNLYKPNQYIVIGPNDYFINYISSVLPDLDVNGVKQLDLEKFASIYLDMPMKKDMLSSCKYVKERIKEYYNNTN